MVDGSRIEIDPRFNGPAGSGQGGYACGLFAELVAAPAEVTLRRPVPLARQLVAHVADAGEAVIKDTDGVLIAEARTAPLEIEVPAPVNLEEAARAGERYRGAAEIFERCFVCGPGRPDSQRVFAGPVEGREIVATTWTPAGEWLAEDDAVPPEFVWAVLDCPTYFALEGARPGLLAMLGRLSARLLEPIAPGEPHVVIAWPIGSERRKHEAGSAVFSGSGELKAAARAIQIEVSAVAAPPATG